MSVVANVAINVDSSGAVSKLRQVQTQATATERAFGGVTAAVGKLVAAFAAVQAIKFVFVQAAELQSQTRSLEVLTGSAQKAGQIIKELQQLGAVTPFTSAELIDSAKRLQAFGVETEKVVATTKRLADVSGATGAELQGLVTAYGQVQAKGRLQGEELLQFQERGVALQVELRKMYGLSGDEFQKALEKGRIGAEAVEVAIVNLTNAGGKYANGAIAQSDTLNGKLSTLQDSFQQLARNIGTFFEPVFKFLIDGINAFLDRVNNGLRASAQIQANEQAAIRTRNKFGAFRAANPFDQEAQAYEERLRKSLLKATPTAGRGAGAPSAPGVPALLGARSGGGTTGGTTGGAKGKADDTAARVAASAAELSTARQLFEIEGRLLEARQGSIEPLILARTAQKELLAINAEAAAIRAGDLSVAQKTNELNKLAVQAAGVSRQFAFDIGESQRKMATEQLKLDQDKLNSVQKYIEKQYELNTAVQQQKELTDGIATTLGQGMTSAFNALIQGSESFGASLRKIASGVLIDIANQLLRIYVIEQAINAIKTFITPFSAATPLGAGGGMVGKFGTLGPNYGIPQRAKGGPVSSGSPYMVGERGPELFMPGRSGNIVPNNALGGGGSVNVVVNVDANGSSVQGDEPSANQLGRVISVAVQAELVKQQRPGGLLSGTR